MARKHGERRTVRDGGTLLLLRREYVRAGLSSAALGAALVAAGGVAGAEPNDELRIKGTGSLATYDVTVSGSIEDSEHVSFDASRNVSGGNAEGVVRDDPHGYRFTGEVLHLQVRGEATVSINGVPVPPAEF